MRAFLTVLFCCITVLFSKQAVASCSLYDENWAYSNLSSTLLWLSGTGYLIYACVELARKKTFVSVGISFAKSMLLLSLPSIFTDLESTLGDSFLVSWILSLSLGIVLLCLFPSLKRKLAEKDISRRRKTLNLVIVIICVLLMLASLTFESPAGKNWRHQRKLDALRCCEKSVADEYFPKNGIAFRGLEDYGCTADGYCGSCGIFDCRVCE